MPDFISKRKAQRMLFWFGLLKIPLIGFVRPKIVVIDEQRCVIKIPFKRRTRNHVGSLYIANFAIGADLATGFLAYFIAKHQQIRTAPIFKSLNAQFHKRAEANTYFICESGQVIQNMLEQVQATGERQNEPIPIKCVTDFNTPKEEIVAECEIELSLKVK